MDLALPQGYVTRPPTLDDAAGLAALIAAAQRAYGDSEPVSAVDILADWDGLDLTDDTLLITTPEGDLAAYADIDNRGNVIIAVYGFVRPEHQGRGLGAALVRWGERWGLAHIDAAPPETRVIAQHYIPALDTRARALVESLGYLPARTVYKMGITLDHAPAVPDAIGEITFRDYVPGQDERSTYEAMTEAFLDHWGSIPQEFDRWLETSQTDRSNPGYWHLAEDRAAGEIVGTCLGRAAGGQGWINGVGVRRAWRRRGIADALLARAFAAYYQRGIYDVGLSVDSESSTGAPHLYTRAGMHVAQSYLVYRKTLREGEEPRVDAGV